MSPVALHGLQGAIHINGKHGKVLKMNSTWRYPPWIWLIVLSQTREHGSRRQDKKECKEGICDSKKEQKEAYENTKSRCAFAEIPNISALLQEIKDQIIGTLRDKSSAHRDWWGIPVARALREIPDSKFNSKRKIRKGTIDVLYILLPTVDTKT